MRLVVTRTVVMGLVVRAIGAAILIAGLAALVGSLNLDADSLAGIGDQPALPQSGSDVDAANALEAAGVSETASILGAGGASEASGVLRAPGPRSSSTQRPDVTLRGGISISGSVFGLRVAAKEDSALADEVEDLKGEDPEPSKLDQKSEVPLPPRSIVIETDNGTDVEYVLDGVVGGVGQEDLLAVVRRRSTGTTDFVKVGSTYLGGVVESIGFGSVVIVVEEGVKTMGP